jgi:hypothetical protein
MKEREHGAIVRKIANETDPTAPPGTAPRACPEAQAAGSGLSGRSTRHR